MQLLYDEPLPCRGPNGLRDFHLHVYFDSVVYVCQVRSVPYPHDHQFFELILRPLNATVLQVVGIFAHHTRYRKVGIPDTLLPRMAQLLGRRIRSSPKTGSEGSTDQWRTDDATVMWKRLVEHHLAFHDADDDIYWVSHTPPENG